MDIIRKIQYLLFCLLAIGFVACDDDDNNSTETGYEGILAQLAEEVDATKFRGMRINVKMIILSAI